MGTGAGVLRLASTGATLFSILLGWHLGPGRVVFAFLWKKRLCPGVSSESVVVTVPGTFTHAG
jgi:hypothetical protein